MKVSFITATVFTVLSSVYASTGAVDTNAPGYSAPAPPPPAAGAGAAPTCPAVEVVTDTSAPYCDDVLPAGCSVPGTGSTTPANNQGAGTPPAANPPPAAANSGRSSVDNGQSGQTSQNHGSKFIASTSMMAVAVIAGVVFA
jgi:hypothetical protein